MLVISLFSPFAMLANPYHGVFWLDFAPFCGILERGPILPSKRAQLRGAHRAEGLRGKLKDRN